MGKQQEMIAIHTHESGMEIARVSFPENVGLPTEPKELCKAADVIGFHYEPYKEETIEFYPLPEETVMITEGDLTNDNGTQ